MSDVAAAGVAEVIDRTGDRGQRDQIGAFRGARLEAVRKLFLDEAGRELARAPARMLHHRSQEWHVVLDAIDIESVERPGLSLDRGGAGRRMRHELGDHRIVEHRDLAAFEDAGVVANRDAVLLAFRGRAILHEASDRRQEVAERVFRIDAAFDGPAVELDVRLLEGKLFTGRDADHLLDEINARHELGDRVFDLQTRVHFQEEE